MLTFIQVATLEIFGALMLFHWEGFLGRRIRSSEWMLCSLRAGCVLSWICLTHRPIADRNGFVGKTGECRIAKALRKESAKKDSVNQ